MEGASFGSSTHQMVTMSFGLRLRRSKPHGLFCYPIVLLSIPVYDSRQKIVGTMPHNEKEGQGVAIGNLQSIMDPGVD
ncbi:glycoside hydrolase family 17 protein [Moniliophthora roreri]|nr:glycoside hydrolase family 17 protein [Moniliophthora roreri]